MAHLSVATKRLDLKKSVVKTADDLRKAAPEENAVFLFITPFDPWQKGSVLGNAWMEGFEEFFKKCSSDSVVCVLTTPEAGASFLAQCEGYIHYKLWISVKLATPVAEEGRSARHHAALLVLTKYKGSLRHTKTRIAYTYCPFCEKTSKDYGGKKHTYHEYGTLMSDVWRDITCRPDAYPEDIASRLQDVFGLEPYKHLYCFDMRAGVRFKRALHIPDESADAEGVQKVMGDNNLLCGDCVELMERVPSNSIDFCFADPPYNLKKKYDSWDDGLDVREYFRWCDKWLGELARVLKPGRTLAVLNIPLWAVRHFDFLRSVMRFQAWIVWEGLSLPVRMIMPAHYAIVCFSKGGPRQLPGLGSNLDLERDRQEMYGLKEFYCSRASCCKYRQRVREADRALVTDLWWDIHRLKHNSRRVDHPCQLPPALMRRLMALYTEPGDVVLDPFNGVGTTSLSAEQMERRFVGMELSEYYHEIAEKRHLELRSGIDPFRKTKQMPIAKNSLVRRVKTQKYEIPKKKLQMEVKRIAHDLGRLPNRAEVEEHGRYAIRYYDEYFISWGEVCAAARTTGMVETKGQKGMAKEDAQILLFKEVGL